MVEFDRRFCVVTTQRSGSVFFESLLNSSGDVYCYPEVFYPDNIKNEWCFYNFWLKKVNQDEYNITHFRIKSVLEEFFDYVFGLITRKAVGVDIKYNHFNLFPYQNQVIGDKIGKVIHLIRKNFLKTQISFLICERRGELGIESHVTRKVKIPKIVLPANRKLIDVLKLRRSQIINFRRFLTGKMNYMEVYYEDLKGEGKREVLEMVFDFLGVKTGKPDYKTDLIKIVPDNLEDAIENYDEFRDFLGQYGFGYLLLFENAPVPGAEWESVDDKRELLVLGKDFLKQGDYDSAINCFLKILKENPNDREIVMISGKLFEKMGRVKEAISLYKNYLKDVVDSEVEALLRDLTNKHYNLKEVRL